MIYFCACIRAWFCAVPFLHRIELQAPDEYIRGFFALQNKAIPPELRILKQIKGRMPGVLEKETRQ